MQDTTHKELSLPLKSSVIGLMCLATVFLLAIPALKTLGWTLLAGISVFLLCMLFRSSTLTFPRDMLLLCAMLALLGFTPVNTDISWEHMLSMGAAMTLAVAIPFFVTRRIFKEKTISFPFRHGRKWYRKEIAYVAVAAALAYFLLPFYLHQTGSYLNWTVDISTFDSIARLFVGTNALGIWDELFFIGTALALFRKHIPFALANVAQAVLFCSFLYELGFRGWGPVATFIFALTQGFIFKNSKSFLYILTIHLTIDFILFLVLIHLHHPEHLRIFITSPL